jgi:hypothetical protein
MDMNKTEEKKRSIEFNLIDDENMPPIVITIGEGDLPKVVLNQKHKIWLSLYRKCIGGCAESLYEKIDELLTAHLTEQRMYENME